jgi:ABC-type phosphate/phosphonate transport system ATPase subunit
MKAGQMVYDGPPSGLTEELAREVYMGGGEEDEEFSAAITSTTISQG